MILCEQPWYNEPGREISENKTMSAKYNDDVRRWTMQYAQLPWINAIEANEANEANRSVVTFSTVTPLWRETARLYLLANANEICNLSKQTATRTKGSTLQIAADAIVSALQSKGYLDQADLI